MIANNDIKEDFLGDCSNDLLPARFGPLLDGSEQAREYHDDCEVAHGSLWSHQTLELRVLSVKWSKVPLQGVSRCRTPPSRTGLFTAAPSGLAGPDKNFREETATAIAGKQTTEAVSGT